jgi:methyltransferase (TIGR00027 family)
MIQNVSDTAYWVAYYRELESERADALFKDPLAKILVGSHGKTIAENMKFSMRYTHWVVVIRTCIIDQYIQKLLDDGIDTVINLGAGLDTRPYRLQLPPNLHWIEVDYPHTIEHKNKVLAAETPRCRLERIALDLADGKKRKELFARLGSQSKKALILTEGVIPYLSEENVLELAADLLSQGSFTHWIVEYFSPMMEKYFKSKKSMKKMKNAPFLFFPKDWFKFFENTGWQPEDIRYIPIESLKLHRKIPSPWWAILLYFFMSKKRRKDFMKMSGYALMHRKPY